MDAVLALRVFSNEERARAAQVKAGEAHREHAG